MSLEPENCEDIIRAFLESNGYTALANPDIECGCYLDDFMPCDGVVKECQPAYKIKAHCDNCEAGCDGKGESEFCISLIKPEVKDGSIRIDSKDCG